MSKRDLRLYKYGNGTLTKSGRYKVGNLHRHHFTSVEDVLQYLDNLPYANRHHLQQLVLVEYAASYHSQMIAYINVDATTLEWVDLPTLKK